MNEIYARLKKATFKGNVIIGVILMLVGIFLLIVPNMDLISYLTASQNVFELAVEGLDEDTFYTGYINYLLDCYAGDDEGNYYITSSENVNGDVVLMGVFIYNDSVSEADRIVDLTWEALEKEGESYTQNVCLKGRGYVYSMTQVEEDYFDDYLKESLETDDVSEYVCHKTFVLTPFSKMITPGTVITALFALLLVVIGLIMILSYVTGGYKKKIKKVMANNNIREAELVMDLAGGVHLKNVDIGKKYMMIYDKGGRLIPYSTLVWAYAYELKTRHMLYGVIPTGTTTSYSIQFYDVNGKNYQYSIKQKYEGEEILSHLSRMAPYLLIGFSEQLKQAAAQNYGQLVQSVAEERRKYEADMMAGGFGSDMAPTDAVSVDPYFG